MMTIIILGGHWSALAIARGFGRKGRTVYCHDRDPAAPALSSRYVNPLAIGADEGELIAALENFETDGNKPTLFVTSDRYLAFLHRNFDRLKQRFAFQYESADLIASLLSKSASADLFEQRGVKAPRTVVSGPESEVAALALPLVVKPVVQTQWTLDPRAMAVTGNHKAIICRDDAQRAAMTAALAPFGPAVAQELVPADPNGRYYFVGCRSRSGKIVATFCGRKIRTLQNGMGSETALQTVADADVRALGADVLQRLEIVGVAGIDILRSQHDSSLWVIEVNYRFGLSDALPVFAGQDLPMLAAEIAEGREPIDAPSARLGTQWIWLTHDAPAVRAEGLSLTRYAAQVLRDWLGGRLMINEVDLRDPRPGWRAMKPLLARFDLGRLSRLLGASWGQELKRSVTR